ncbi:MAG: DUF4157 domain-containing protein [Chitinophagaceae bacterium]|nr:DUF4157 domain-containing protein [Chitinophagaceae bacterium]
MKLADPHFTIKEHSWIARIAAWKLKSRSVAIVVGSTIHLHNSSAADFLKNERWLKHELCHIRQYQQHGYIGFIIKYLWESLLSGYYNNKFEVEARKAEEE